MVKPYGIEPNDIVLTITELTAGYAHFDQLENAVNDLHDTAFSQFRKNDNITELYRALCALSDLYLSGCIK